MDLICLNQLNAELNPICHLLALLAAHHISHVSGLRVNEFKQCLVSEAGLRLSQGTACRW